MKLVRSLSFITLSLCSIFGYAQSDAYPQRPVKLVVGYPPGGTLDIVGRLLANELQKDLKQSVIVENKAGAGGMVGAQTVARSTPDGYTLLMAIGSHTVLPAIHKKMPYETLGDFAPIAMVGTSPNMLVVRADYPAKTLVEFLQQAKNTPEKVNYGTPGIGTTTHITAVMLERSSNVTMNHIPYKGSAETTQALLSGQIPVAFASIVSAGPAIRDGRMRALGIVGKKRSALLPDVPTFEESKVKDVLGDNWLGVLVPAGTPPAVLNRLQSAIASITARPDFHVSLRAQGVEPNGLGPVEFGRVLKDEVAAYKEVAKATNLGAD